MKKHTTDWEKIFAKHVFDKGLASGIEKESQNSIMRKLSTQLKINI